MTRDDFLRFVKTLCHAPVRGRERRWPHEYAARTGHHIDTDNVLDFPVSIISWEDRVPDNPSLQENEGSFCRLRDGRH